MASGAAVAVVGVVDTVAVVADDDVEEDAEEEEEEEEEDDRQKTEDEKPSVERSQRLLLPLQLKGCQETILSCQTFSPIFEYPASRCHPFPHSNGGKEHLSLLRHWTNLQ